MCKLSQGGLYDEFGAQSFLRGSPALTARLFVSCFKVRARVGMVAPPVVAMGPRCNLARRRGVSLVCSLVTWTYCK